MLNAIFKIIFRLKILSIQHGQHLQYLLVQHRDLQNITVQQFLRHLRQCLIQKMEQCQFRKVTRAVGTFENIDLESKY